MNNRLTNVSFLLRFCAYEAQPWAYICKDKKMVTPQLLNILLHISIRMRDLVVSVVFPAHKIHGITGVADELELVIDH